MPVPELAKAGLNVCDETEKAIMQGEMGQAIALAQRLINVTDELDRVDPVDKSDPSVKKSIADLTNGYRAVPRFLLIALEKGDLEMAQLSLQVIRVLLAEAIPDEALAQSYEHAALPTIGSA